MAPINAPMPAPRNSDAPPSIASTSPPATAPDAAAVIASCDDDRPNTLKLRAENRSSVRNEAAASRASKAAVVIDLLNGAARRLFALN